MGCWNETCALTHLPIKVGMPVVALSIVTGASYKSGESSQDTALLFGVPFEGTYDDYGGVENLVNPEQAELQARAFETAGYYRRVSLKRAYGSSVSWLLASHPDTLWDLAQDLKEVFYSELGITLSDVSSNAKEPQAKVLNAFKLAEAALISLGTQLGSLSFAESVEDAEQQLFAVFEDVFGKDKAGYAMSIIRHKGLFVHQDMLLMHKAAYDAVVAEFGQRKVGFYHEKTRVPVRQFLAKQLDNFLAKFPQAYEKAARLFGDEANPLKPLEATVEERKRVLRYVHIGQHFRIMAPLTQLWQTPEMPLIGHFWGGAFPDEIMKVISKETILDFMVFQWSRFYLRVPLTKPSGGSQNEEVVLHDKMFKATMRMLKANGAFKRDFDGTLFR